mmetsp:Transcript_45089/g.143643  ORF Transcript_45089/g.143643 Transcript_45089/m.143643 type:complete len:227 (+) Transcript_45089:2051-2731(+)
MTLRRKRSRTLLPAPSWTVRPAVRGCDTVGIPAASGTSHPWLVGAQTVNGGTTAQRSGSGRVLLPSWPSAAAGCTAGERGSAGAARGVSAEGEACSAEVSEEGSHKGSADAWLLHDGKGSEMGSGKLPPSLAGAARGVGVSLRIVSSCVCAGEANGISFVSVGSCLAGGNATGAGSGTEDCGSGGEEASPISLRKLSIFWESPNGSHGFDHRSCQVYQSSSASSIQ